jgi:L-alanine-DL-glutamate epimerase-like enolase superfamily enzyme
VSVRLVRIRARTVSWALAGEGAARDRTERAAIFVEVTSDEGCLGLGTPSCRAPRALPVRYAR